MTTSSSQADELKREFPEQALKELSKGGRSFTYAPASEVVTRLNTVLGVGGWQTVESEAWIDKNQPDWVIAKYTLKANVDGEDTVRTGWGGQKIKFKDGEPQDLGDEFKGASSDALKKAASHLGVALYLSRDEEIIAVEEEATKEKASPEVVTSLKSVIGGLAEETRSEISTWWKTQKLPRLESGDLTIEQVEQVVDHFGLTDPLNPES